MGMDPSNRDNTLCNLCLKHFDFILHGTLVMTTSLCWDDQSSDVQLAVSLLTSKDATCLDMAIGVRI